MSLAERSSRLYDSLRRDDAAHAAEGEAVATGFDHLKGHKYCLAITYRRSGEAVPTPVWFGIDDRGRLYFRTVANTAKVRRIRNDGRARVAPCTARGKPRGPAAEGRARLLDPDEEAHAERTIASNYRLFRRAYVALGGRTKRLYVEVTPA